MILQDDGMRLHDSNAGVTWNYIHAHDIGNGTKRDADFGILMLQAATKNIDLVLRYRMVLDGYAIDVDKYTLCVEI